MFKGYREETGFTLDNIDGFNKRILKYSMLIDEDVFKLKRYLDEQKDDSMLHLFRAKPSELVNDNVGTEFEKDDLNFKIKDAEAYHEGMQAMKDHRELTCKEGDVERSWASMPNEVEDDRLKARMVSFKQLYDFNNLVLNRSFLKKRTKVSEDHIEKL